MLTDRDLIEDMSSSLKQILDVLRDSTIAEERGKDVESKFWVAYEKVSSGYDDDFLGRANDDMAIILTFAGLFSAVNSTFIIGMQPDTGDTTNALMLQAINIMVNGPNATNISSLSSLTPYSSSTAWMQALSYASLAFSVLAAFGAVMGKQWLNSYKVARGRGSLEERGMQRQRKLDGLESWKLQTVLNLFLILLQISLFLFGLSLSANLWSRQKTISIVIISTTAFGILLYVATILVAVLRPDSPFHTAGSALVSTICKNFLACLTDNTFIKSSAIRWLLETSTNPDVVEAAAGIVPLAQWRSDLDASAIYTRLRDTFTTYRGNLELFVKCGKAMAHLCIQSVKIDPGHLQQEWETWDAWGGKSLFIRDAFMAGSDAWDKLKMEENSEDPQKLKADARTALRTMVVHGQRGRLSRPDDERLIWDGDLQWRHKDGRTPRPEEFDWLIDYLLSKVDHERDDETQVDALLALSAMHELGSDVKRPSYIKVLTRCMAHTRPLRVRYAAARVICDAREELSAITDILMPHGINAEILDRLSGALLALVCLNDNQTFGHERDDISSLRTRCYLRLIFALAKNDEWRRRLRSNQCLKQWMASTDASPSSDSRINVDFYRAGIYLRMYPSWMDESLIQERDTLMRKAWRGLSFINPAEKGFDGCLEILPALVTATGRNLFDGVPTNELQTLDGDVEQVLRILQGDESPGRVAILSAVLQFSEDLKSMLEQPYSNKFE